MNILNFRKWFFCKLLKPAKNSWLYLKADCKRYDEEEPTVGLRICTVSGDIANEYCEMAGTVEFKEFKASEAPKNFCTVHKKEDEQDPVVKFTRCRISKHRPRESCRMLETVKIKKSEIPAGRCEDHKLPKRRRIRFFHHDGLGILLDFLAHAWKKKDQAETEQRLMDYFGFIAGEGIDIVAAFSYLHTNKLAHKHLNWKIPFLCVKTQDGKKADLAKENPRYYELFDRFCELLSIAKLRLQIIAEMDRYTTWIYQNNVNGVPGFWHARARPFQEAHLNRMLKIMLKYWDLDDIFIVAVNEAAHAGSDEQGHIIADYHKDIWLFCKSLGLKLKNFWADISLSEFARAELVFHGWYNSCLSCGHHWTGKINDLKTSSCPNCGHPGWTQDPVTQVEKYWIDRSYDCPKCRRLWDNIEEYGRDCVPIKHGFSILKDVLCTYDEHINIVKAVLGSANDIFKITEDGSSNPECEGFVIGHGYPWRLGSAAQNKEMMIYVWTECKDASRKKIFIWGIYPMETFLVQSWGLEEYYSVKSVNKERFAAVCEAYEEVYETSGG